MKTISFKSLFPACLLLILIQPNLKSQTNDSTLFPWTYFYISSLHDTTGGFSGDNIPSGDVLEDSAWLTGLDQGGIPLDIISVDDYINENAVRKLFVYTERRLIVIDEETRQITNSIDVSNHGSQALIKLTATNSTLARSREKHLAYDDERQVVYCLTSDLNIQVVDPDREEITGTITTGVNQYTLWKWAILKYNSINQQIYLSFTRTISGTDYTKLLSYEFSSGSYSVAFSLDLGQVNDYAFNPQYDLLYLSDNNSVQVRNATSGQLLNTVSTPYTMGVIFNAYNPSLGLNRIYCLPKAEVINSTARIFEQDDLSPSLSLNLDKGYFTCGNYNPISNRLFLGYSNGLVHDAGVINMTADQHSNIQQHSFGMDYVFDMANSNSRVFIGCKNQIVVYNNYTQLSSHNINALHKYFFRMASTSYFGDYIFALSTADQEVMYCASDNYQWSTPPIKCSGVAYHGFFNPTNSKAYFYNGHEFANHDLYIFNPDNDDIQTIDLGFAPTGMAFDKNSKTLYACGYSNLIRRLNTINHSWITPEIVLPEGYGKCNELFFSINHLLFCSVSNMNNFTPAVLVYNTAESIEDPVLILDIPNFSGQYGNYDTHFEVDESHGHVFIAINELYTVNGCVIRFEPDLNYKILSGISHPDKMFYNPHNDKIVVKHYDPWLYPGDQITLIDFESSPPSSSGFIPKQNVAVRDMALDIMTGYLFCSFEDNSGDIRAFNSSGDFMRQLHLANMTTTLKANPINNLIYVHVPKNTNNDRREEIWTINPVTFNTALLYLNQSEGHFENSYYLTDLILDQQTNKLYMTNAHGNIKVIQCTFDQIPLEPSTWNWLSIPRLDRPGNDPVPSVPLLETIPPFPPESKRILLNIPPNEELPIDKTYDHPNWTGPLETVQSTLGYKLWTGNTEANALAMTGSVLNPATTMTVYPERENWLGYFLPYPQHPFDAIPHDLLANLKFIKARYWSCVNAAFIAPPTKSSASVPGEWRCACNQTKIELNYHDMVILTKGNPGQQVFAWNQAGGSSALVEKPAPELFTFQSTADYDALFLELDTTGLPDEIGAFAGDSCIGATKVAPGDTSALICAYTEGLAGEPISFAYAWQTKKSHVSVPEYCVMNTRTGIREKRQITAGEKQPYFLVSFRQQADDTPSASSDAWVQCAPNPADEILTVSFFIDTPQTAWLRITDALGRLQTVHRVDVPAPGTYSRMMELNNWPNGCYVVSLSTTNAFLVEKLLILH
jgi:hypothetical protein